MDRAFLFLLGVIYGITFLLITYQIELRFRLLCRIGIHKRKGYRCLYCKKPKNHPHLKVIEGGKKALK